MQYAFLDHLHLLLHLRVTLPTHTHIVFRQNDKDCVVISSAVFKICGQRSVNLSCNLRFEVHCMQSVICSLQSVVCSLQFAVCSLQRPLASDRASFLDSFSSI